MAIGQEERDYYQMHHDCIPKKLIKNAFKKLPFGCACQEVWKGTDKKCAICAFKEELGL